MHGWYKVKVKWALGFKTKVGKMDCIFEIILDQMEDQVDFGSDVNF